MFVTNKPFLCFPNRRNVLTLLVDFVKERLVHSIADDPLQIVEGLGTDRGKNVLRPYITQVHFFAVEEARHLEFQRFQRRQRYGSASFHPLLFMTNRTGLAS